MFTQDEYGPLKVLELPEPEMAYVLGIDVSTGLSDDYTAMQVLTSTQQARQVAVFKAKWPVSEVADFANRLGRYYNTALIVCEVNYPGNSVQDALIQVYRYPKNYQFEQHLDSDPDISDKYGFKTVEATKWMLIRELQQALKDRQIELFDPDTIAELRNFVYQSSKQRACAAEGFNDDLVMALMLAYHGALMYPSGRPLKPLPTDSELGDPDVRKFWRLVRERILNPIETKENEYVVCEF